ncbi:MAG: TonB family protein [Pseudomonadota bacterium]
MSKAPGNTADILDMEEARARRQDFATHTGFDTAGAYLRDLREASGLTLEDISLRTHIREQHLRGIETGDLSLLPARAYVSGFVKTYAEMLGLDPAPIVTRFREDVGLSKPETVDPKGFETAEVRAEAEKKDMSFLSVFAVIAFILWCSWQVMEAKTRNEADRTNAAAMSAPTDSPAALQDTVPGQPVPVGLPVADIPVVPTAITDPLADPPLADADGTVIAHITERIEPVYPRLCEGQAGPQETVDTTFNITSDGRVAGARVVTASNDCFRRAALNALKRWRFSPQIRAGQPVATYDQTLTFVFKRPA